MNEEFNKEFMKLSEKDQKEVVNLIRFKNEVKYHDKEFEKLLEQYIELSREYEKLQHQLEQEIIKKEKLRMHIMYIKETIEVWDLDYKDGYVDFEIPKKIKDVVFRSESDE